MAKIKTFILGSVGAVLALIVSVFAFNYMMRGSVKIENQTAEPITNIRLVLKTGSGSVSEIPAGDLKPHSSSDFRLPTFPDSTLLVTFDHQAQKFEVNCSYYGNLNENYLVTVPAPPGVEPCHLVTAQ